MVSMKKVLFETLILLSIIVGSGCLTQTDEPLSTSEPTPTQLPTMPDFQESNISDESCAECHINAYTLMSTNGGKHDKGCTFCHVQHGIIPRCADCHELIHGPQLTDCKDCHDEHAPLNMIGNEMLDNSCSDCHQSQITEFEEYPGKHLYLKCIDCHQNHGEFEVCTNCHIPHYPEMKYESCLLCHSPHMPQEIIYPEDIDNANCAACHGVTSDELNEGSTKHSSLQCSYCHQTHGQIPECMDCHSPHLSYMSNDDCIECHPAHNPLDIELPSDRPREECAICHDEIDIILKESNTKHDTLGCIYCHPRHRYIPTCESCHGLTHERMQIHDDFPVCAQCHVESHDVDTIVIRK